MKNNRNQELLFPDIFGNESIKKRLSSDIVDGTLFHTIMLVGESGTGKRTFAYHIAAALACQHRTDDEKRLPCGECAECKKILSGNSLDVMFIDKEDRETIGVDNIRELRGDAVISSNDLDFKVYIINEFHTMTPQAQNAALKIFEEPPKNVYFILLCENIQSVLETVISRVIRFNTKTFSESEMKQYLLEHSEYSDKLKKEDDSLLDQIVKYSRGSIGRALNALRVKPDAYKKMLDEYRLPEMIIQHIASGIGKLQCVELICSLSLERSKMSLFLSDMALAARDIVAYKSNPDTDLSYYINREDAGSVASKIPLRRVFAIAELSVETRASLSKNINVRLLRDKFMLDLFKIFNS